MESLLERDVAPTKDLLAGERVKNFNGVHVSEAEKETVPYRGAQ